MQSSQLSHDYHCHHDYHHRNYHHDHGDEQDNNAACNLILALEGEDLTVESIGNGAQQVVIIWIWILMTYLQIIKDFNFYSLIVSLICFKFL